MVESGKSAVTLALQTEWALARALAVAAASLALAFPLARLLAGVRGRAAALAWTLLLTPWLTPSLLTAYAWSHVALAAIAQPGWSELFYSALLVMKLTPIAALALHFLPSPLSRECLHCHSLLPALSLWETLRFRLRGAGRAPALAFCAVFLLAFSEFELAARWGIKTWTVAIFDAHAGGLPLADSLRLAAPPVLCELIVLAIGWLSFRAELALGNSVSNCAPELHFGKWSFVGKWSYLGLAGAIVAVFPLLFVASQSLPGVLALVENFTLARDLTASFAFAICAAAAATFLARAAHRSRAAIVLLAFPGLLGALVLSLLVLTFFQNPAFRTAYDSPLPLLLALTLLLMPLALVLRALLAATRPGEALHLARLLGSRLLLWQLETRRDFAAAFLLFCWAYFDFTASSILAPLGFTPVFVRLHNLMHYGQNAVLSAMLLAAFALPVAALLLTAAAGRWNAVRA